MTLDYFAEESFDVVRTDLARDVNDRRLSVLYLETCREHRCERKVQRRESGRGRTEGHHFLNERRDALDDGTTGETLFALKDKHHPCKRRRSYVSLWIPRHGERSKRAHQREMVVGFKNFVSLPRFQAPSLGMIDLWYDTIGGGSSRAVTSSGTGVIAVCH